MPNELLNKVKFINVYKKSDVESEVNKIREKITNVDFVNLEESLGYVLEQVWSYNSGAIKGINLLLIIF